MNFMLWLELHLHFCMLSLLAVGGALAIVPEMHRYLVNDLQLLSEQAFSQSVTLSQIAPGPNILLVAVMGWNIGLQTAGGADAGREGETMPSEHRAKGCDGGGQPVFAGCVCHVASLL